jgi:DNA-binding helix-hairpin-helix protein with protein kinase domain
MLTLRPGQELHCLNTGHRCVVEVPLGEGGQGEVWRVRVGDDAYALKWFNDKMLEVDRDLRHRIERLVTSGAPSKRFLWPFEIVVSPAGGRRFGYLQRLRSESYVELRTLLASTTQVPFRVLAEMCYLLCDELFALHSKGLCYADLNANNVFVNGQTGDIEIFDNDNVDIDGKPGVMYGFPGFQAPEVVLRTAGSTRMTDLHSLAVMLFKIFHEGHPLQGQAESRLYENPELIRLDPRVRKAEVNRRLYGSEARFIFDPNDASNRPIPELHGRVMAYWSIYPQFFRDIFTKAFTTGLVDPEYGRVTLSEWRKTMARLRDAVLTCPACDCENFYDAQRGDAHVECWDCHCPLSTQPLRLELRTRGARAGAAAQHIVVLENKAKLFAHHTDGGRYDFGRVTGTVQASPAVLRNCSERPWTVTHGEHKHEIAPGREVELMPGVRVHFASADGDVVGQDTFASM